MEEEVREYRARESIRPWQTWSGDEPALQLLCLPTDERLPPYSDTLEYIDPEHCRLCLMPVSDAAMESHLQEQHDGLTLEQYRRTVLQRSLSAWPEAISPQVLRGRLAAFMTNLCDSKFEMKVCGSCAREKRREKLSYCRIPSVMDEEAPSWLSCTADEWSLYKKSWCSRMDELLNVKTYLAKFFGLEDLIEKARGILHNMETGATEPTPDTSIEAKRAYCRRLEICNANLLRDLRLDSVPNPSNRDERWLLYADSVGDAVASALDTSNSLFLWLCKKCKAAFAHKSDIGTPTPKLPERARANGLWGGPLPAELECLTYSERKVIQLARCHVCVKRVFLDARSYKRPSGRAELPKFHEKNVVAYPYHLDLVSKVLGAGPQRLAEAMTIQFVGNDRSLLHREPDLQVSCTRLRDAFYWLAFNCPPWIEATKHELITGRNHLGGSVEDLLHQYHQSTGVADGAVPAELLQAATQICEQHAHVLQAGPSDAVAPEGGTDNSSKPSDRNTADLSGCAAAVQGGMDDVSPLQLWDHCMKQLQVRRQCDEEIAALCKDVQKGDQEAILKDKRAKAVAEAVRLLRALTNKETRDRLEAATRHLARDPANQTLTTKPEMLSNFHSDFWTMCFIHLFPRGDCQERTPRRSKGSYLPGRTWAKVLITRGDYRRWRRDFEFVACTYNILLRRSQLNAVKWFVEKNAATVEGTLSLITHHDIVAQAMSSGECDSVRDALKKKGKVDQRLQTMYHHMSQVQRNVRGSEAERDILRFRFRAMRLWNGFSSLFFTLSPNDIKSPLTIVFADKEKM